MRMSSDISNAVGTGRGGIGGIYQVAPGSSTACIVSPIFPTSVITSRSVRTSVPSSSVAISAVGGVSSASTTSVRPTTQASDSTAPVVGSTGNSSGLSTGATAGIGAGIGVVAIAAIAGLIFWLMRRRKRSTALEAHPARQVDLNDGPRDPPATTYAGVEPKVEPFPSSGSSPGIIDPTTHLAYSSGYHERGSPLDMSTLGHPIQQYLGGAYSASGGSSTPDRTEFHDRFSISSGQMSPTAINPYFPLVVPGQLPQSPVPQANRPLSKIEQERARQAQFQNPPTGFSSMAHMSARASSVSGSSSSGQQPPLSPISSTMVSEVSRSSKLSNDTTAHAAANASGTINPEQHSQPEEDDSQPGPVEFRRHQDAESSAVVDLPPLYQDVPQRGPTGGS
jgi:hypothetical protein